MKTKHKLQNRAAVQTQIKMKKLAVAVSVCLSMSAPAWVSAETVAVTSANVPAAATGVNEVQQVQYTSQTGGEVLVKITLKDGLAALPASFATNVPPRIALDLPNTRNSMDKTTLAIEEGPLRSMNVVQAGARTRLVLNLSKAASYETRLDGKDLLISLKASQIPNVTSTSSIRFAEAAPPGAVKSQVKDVDFRRGKDGQGRIVVDMSDGNTGVDVRRQGRNLVVEFINTSLPTSLERRLDVVDFGTPVQSVDAVNQGKNARLVIEPKGQWEHSAYQVDKQFVVEVKSVVEDENKLRKKGYAGEKISWSFSDLPIKDFLKLIGEEFGLNILMSESVTGTISLNIKDVPVDQALDIVLQKKGLSTRKQGNVVYVAPTEELLTKEKLELEARQQISELEPLQTEMFQLKYAQVEAFKKIFDDEKNKILSKRGSAVMDPRTNTMFINDTPTKLEEMRRLIEKTDVPQRQVMIETRIVEAGDNFSKNLGARLGFVDMNRNGMPIIGGVSANDRVNLGAKLEGTGYLSGQIEDQSTFDPDHLNVNLPSAGLSGFNAGALALTLFRAGTGRFLNLEISALEADGKGKVISSPRVVTGNNVEATIEQGTEIPYQQSSSSGATTVAFKKAVLSLKVKPQITPDDNVIMDLKVSKNAPDYTRTLFGAVPINTKQIETQALVENGGTVVIGGIYTQDVGETITKVPLFGDIPVVGNLFKNRSTKDQKTELLIFVSPKILKEELNVR